MEAKLSTAFPVHYQDGKLFMEQLDLATVAKEHGTPCYVYSKKHIVDAYTSFQNAFASHPNQICYAVKANSNLSILRLFAKLGAGFDIVSQGELYRVLQAGGDPAKVVFSGVGKTEQEMRFALEKNVGCFNLESEGELYKINKIAGELGKKAPISFRVNPDIDAKTHEKISTGMKKNKFGIAYERAIHMFREAKGCENIQIKGIDCHIGSQITQITPFIDAAAKLLKIVDELKKEDIHLAHIDIGGGLGIVYNKETTISVNEYAQRVLEIMQGRSEKLMFEPGRFLIGNSGVLLSKVEYLKHHEGKNFCIIDAAMNDLMRPALYEAYHKVINLKEPKDLNGKEMIYDIVGPICETGDYIAKEREIYVEEGDVVAILSAGAYAMSMSSNYNTRTRVAEILVDGSKSHIIRERETYEDLVRHEANINIEF